MFEVELQCKTNARQFAFDKLVEILIRSKSVGSNGANGFGTKLPPPRKKACRWVASSLLVTIVWIIGLSSTRKRQKWCVRSSGNTYALAALRNSRIIWNVKRFEVKFGPVKQDAPPAAQLTLGELSMTYWTIAFISAKSSIAANPTLASTMQPCRESCGIVLQLD